MRWSATMKTSMPWKIYLAILLVLARNGTCLVQKGYLGAVISGKVRPSVLDVWPDPDDGGRSTYPKPDPLCGRTTMCLNKDSPHNQMLGVGFDFGTSGVRAVVVDVEGKVEFDSSLHWGRPDDPDEWLRAADTLISEIPLAARRHLSRICVSGTSASCLLVDAHDPSRVVRGPRMYNYNTLTETPEAAMEALGRLERIAPERHTTLSGTSALMKLVSWHVESTITHGEAFCHQADYVSAHIRGARGYGSIRSDWNNALKAGFDVERLTWPEWLLESELGQELRHCLPEVVMPGATLGTVSAAMVYSPYPGHESDGIGAWNALMEKYKGDATRRFYVPDKKLQDIKIKADEDPDMFWQRLLNINAQVDKVIAGTTDSIAAFIAANATEPGHAVTSLGSTLAIKMLSEHRIEDASRGVYSHRLGNVVERERAPGASAVVGAGSSRRGGSEAGEEGEGASGLWLVGGASNVGCAVLRTEGFLASELESLSAEIDPSVDSPLTEYYPLPRGTRGERFPTNDPSRESVLDPRPENRAAYLHGLLQAIARVEKQGYDTLETLGATKLGRVDTAGGGAVNSMWTKMRERILGVPTGKAENTDAAYGCALLAMQGLETQQSPAPTTTAVGVNDNGTGGSSSTGSESATAPGAGSETGAQ